MMKESSLGKALRSKYEYEINKCRVDLDNFFNNPVAVAEHESIVETADRILADLATAEEKLATLDLYIGVTN